MGYTSARRVRKFSQGSQAVAGGRKRSQAVGSPNVHETHVPCIPLLCFFVLVYTYLHVLFSDIHMQTLKVPRKEEGKIQMHMRRETGEIS